MLLPMNEHQSRECVDMSKKSQVLSGSQKRCGSNDARSFSRHKKFLNSVSSSEVIKNG